VFPFLECGLVKERCRQDHQRVEPSACLVKALGDEVRGEPRLKQFLVLEGVVALCVGHGTALKPAVKHLLHPLQIALALLRGYGDVINGVLTKKNSQVSDQLHFLYQPHYRQTFRKEFLVQVRHAHTRELLKFLNRPLTQIL
jgi:hypothetical protein